MITVAELLAERWAEAWNAHDMAAAARLVAADVEFVTVAGWWLRGRDEFLAHHQRIHAMQMRDSRWTNLAVSARALRDHLVLVHLQWAIAGDRDPDGTPRRPREGLFTWLAAHDGEAWRITAAHNTDLRAGVRRRSLGGGGGPAHQGSESMTDMRRRELLAGALALSAAMTGRTGAAAAARAYPSRPVHLLVGGAAGSVPDTVARLLAEQLAAGLGQPVVVENRPGAGGIIAMRGLVGSEPDGHTLALATMSQAVFNSYLFSELPYDPVRDLEPVAPLVSGAFALAAHPGFPPNTLAEFVAAAKAQPGKLFLGTAAKGSPPHVAALMLTRAAGVEVSFVPFTSGRDGLIALMRGDVPLFLDAPTIISPQARAGALKVLVVTGRAREPELPGVQTVAEAGLPSAESEAWIGLVAPARTPSEIVARLNTEISALLARPDLRERLRALSFATVPASPEEFRRLIRDEHARWGATIREAGLKLD